MNKDFEAYFTTKAPRHQERQKSDGLILKFENLVSAPHINLWEWGRPWACVPWW
jgi:hypothetical protein